MSLGVAVAPAPVPVMPWDRSRLDDLTRGYFEAAQFEGDRLDEEQRDEARQACIAFQTLFGGILEDCYAWTLRGVRYCPALAGRDFYYGRTIGKAGGWRMLEDAGEMLLDYAKENKP